MFSYISFVLIFLKACPKGTMAAWPFDSAVLGGGGAAAAPPDRLILVMGLPRSGALSIHNFFTCHGWKSAHYCCGGSSGRDAVTSFPCDANDEENNKNNDVIQTCGHCVFDNMNQARPAFEGCGGYHVFSQFDVETGDPFAWFLPQHFTLPLIHEHYPNATFILNHRGTSEQWATSAAHWFSVTNRFFNSFGINYHEDHPNIEMGLPDGMTNQKLYLELDSGIERAHDSAAHRRRLTKLQEIHDNHLAKVKSFVAEHPEHQLIVLNVDDPNAGSELAQAFQIQESCWKYDAKSLDDDWKDFSLKV